MSDGSTAGTGSQSPASGMPAACLFDFDGVIVDSFAMHELGWRRAFAELTGRELPDCPPEMLTGKSSQQIAVALATLGGEPSLAPSLLHTKVRMLSDGSLLPPLRPGAREAIEWCRRNGIPHGIASNAPGAYLRAALDGHDLQIPVVLGYDDVANPKPDPDLYLRCGELAGLADSDRPQALVFEDSPPGITAAVKAGMHPIGILARLPADLLRLCGAREVYKDLAAWLDGSPVPR
ncbi:HAD family hydrolase [Spirochaeta dissipatitropha]